MIINYINKSNYTKIRQKINRKKDCFLEYKIIDFNIILRDSPYMFNNKKENKKLTQGDYGKYRV